MPELTAWWWPDGMEEGLQGSDGLRFLLLFGPGKQVDRTLLGVSLPALFSRFLGWARSAQGRPAIGEDGRESAAVVSAAALAAAVSVSLAAVRASRHRARLAPRRPRPRAMPGPTSSAPARPRALPAPDDGLRILSSKAESSDTVLHGASIGAGDDEPVIVARVATMQADDHTAGTNNGTERGQSGDEARQHAERLRELWLSLLEREQRLELRLQELEGLREREAAARELEGRAAAEAREACSLQEENARLRARLEELDDARADLARAKERLREVEARVRAEREEARREAAALRARVAEVERDGEERAAEVAAEAAALREANAALEEENMELALRLRDASSARLAVEEQEDMAEQARQLRETNESLTRQVEELRSDQYAHVEELVYLKWVNACLRHELSEHGLPPLFSEHQDADEGSAMSAMELSKSMSFRSSERAKQLMLRYGHPGLDPALLSPLHESIDGANYDERAQRSPAAGTSVTATTAAGSTATASGKKPRKLKFLGNIKKLLPGGKRSHSRHAGRDENGRGREAPAPMASDEYLEKAMQWLSAHDVLDFDHSYETTPLSSCDRTPPSSVTTVTPRRGGGAAQEADAEPATASLARSRSDGGKSYGREVGQYHSIRPDHPAADEKVSSPPQKWERRRRSEELGNLGADRA